MAPFNPPTQDVKPVNPIGWSKAAEVPSAFASALSEGIKGIGNLIGDTAKAGVELVQQNIQKNTAETYDPVMDDRIAQLAGTDFSLRLNNATGGTPNKPAVDLTDNGDPDADNIPAPIKQQLGQAQITAEARANGKISNSQYLGRVLSLAKDLRSQYPVGFRDYIDKEISKITGVDPANAYMQSLTADINANLTTAQNEKNHVLRMIEGMAGHSPDMAKVHTAVSTGAWSLEKGLAWVNNLAAPKVQYQQEKERIDALEAQNRLDKGDATNTFRQFGSDTVARDIKSYVDVNLGLNYQQIQQLTIDALAGKGSMAPQQYIQIARNMEARMAYAVSKLNEELYRVDPKTGKSTYGRIGDDGTKVVNDVTEPYRRIITALNKQHEGLAFDAANMTQAIKSQYSYLMWNNPKLTNPLGIVSTFKDAMGDTALSQLITRTSGVGLALNDAAAEYTKTTMAELAMPADPRGPQFKNVPNLMEALNRTGKIQEQTGWKMGKTFDEIKDMITGPRVSLLNPGTGDAAKDKEMRTNIARNYFGPENRGALRKIATDFTNPRTGETIEGQESWFARWTQPDVAAVIKTLDLQTQAYYKDWVESTHRELFSQNIDSIGKYSEVNKYRVAWDTDNPGFKVDIPQRSTMVRMSGYKQLPIEGDIEKVNKAVRGLYSVYTGLGLSQEEAQVEILKSFNLRPEQKLNGLPERFRQVLEVQYKKEKEEEERKKKDKESYRP